MRWLMRVPVVRIRKMRVVVRHGFVGVAMSMHAIHGHACLVGMVVMRIVQVRMLMFQRLMGMHMMVGLCQVQPYAKPHGQARKHQGRRHRFT